MTLGPTMNERYCNLASIKEMLRYRHLQTHLHCERVVKLADVFARACSLSEREREKLLYSAMFHDLGKIGIPDDILMNEERLHGQQRTIMQMHSAMGEAIVRLMELENGNEIAANVRHHHEHFDGSGYPDGLSDETIPLASRMLSILDSYDALREARPYRPALSHLAAVAIMKSESGVKHDPALLEKFLEIKSLEMLGEMTDRK